MGHLPSLHHQETRGSTPCSCIQVVSWNGRLELQGAGGTWIGVGYHFSMTPFWLCLISSWQEGCLGWSRTFFFFFIPWLLTSLTLLVDWKIKLHHPDGTSGKEPTCQCRRHKRYEFSPWAGKIPGGGHGNPLQYSCLENPMDRGAWRAMIHGVAKSWTWLKWLYIHMQKLRIMFYLADMLRT